MKLTGHLRKMHATLGSPVEYELPLDEQLEPLNPHIGQVITLRATGQIHCVACGRKTKKSYSQGHCYPCSQSLASCDLCIMKPETCHYDEGTCRQPEWGEEHCMQAHYVYLANSSGIKVGITRQNQVPTRWIDQGASQALAILKVKHRRLSGLVEVALKKHVSDRTDWRRMLKGTPEFVDLQAKRDELLAATAHELAILREQFGADSILELDDRTAATLDYPVNEYPTKVSSFNFDKTPEIRATLMGIKGQYLIFDKGVLNIRKFGGYEIELETN